MRIDRNITLKQLLVISITTPCRQKVRGCIYCYMLTGNKYISEQCNRVFTDSLPSYIIVHDSLTRWQFRNSVHKCIYLASCQWKCLVSETTCQRNASELVCQRNVQFLPRCMQCRRGLGMRNLSVSPSVLLSNACIVTKQKKDYYTIQKII